MSLNSYSPKFEYSVTSIKTLSSEKIEKFTDVFWKVRDPVMELSSVDNLSSYFEPHHLLDSFSEFEWEGIVEDILALDSEIFEEVSNSLTMNFGFESVSQHRKFSIVVDSENSNEVMVTAAEFPNKDIVVEFSLSFPSLLYLIDSQSGVLRRHLQYSIKNPVFRAMEYSSGDFGPPDNYGCVDGEIFML